MTREPTRTNSMQSRQPCRREFNCLSLAAGIGSVPVFSTVAPQIRSQEQRPTNELIQAISEGKRDLVHQILNRHPDLKSAKDDRGRSMFVLAYMHRERTIADDLLERGIELDIVESVLAEDTQRFVALAKRDPASVNALHPIGGNAYYAAAKYGKPSMIWPLNRWGGNPNQILQGSAGVSAFRAAFDYPDPSVAAQVAMRILVDAGDATVEQQASDSVLHAAAALGDQNLVRALIRRGADVHAQNASGETPVQVARRAGHDRVVTVLGNHQGIARQNRSSRFVYNANGKAYVAPTELGVDQLTINRFCELCHFRFDDAKAIFLQHPAVIHGVASWDELGVEACAHMERSEWTKYLLDKGAPMSLATALAVNDVATVRRLLTENKDRIHARGPHDFALMWYPQIAGGIVELAEILLDFGADVDEHKFGTTCLHRAAYYGQTDLVKFLLERGADVKKIGKSDFSQLRGTPLDWAKAGKRSAIVSLLKQSGGR